MNILMIHPHDLFDPHEPWTIRIESLAHEFVKEGHTVRVIHFINELSIEKYTIHAKGFEVISLRRKVRIPMLFSNSKEILKHCRWADVIHFQKCFHYVSLPALWGSVLYGKPIHYDWDDLEEAIYEASCHPPDRMIHFFLKTFERIIPTIVDTVSVASKELKDKCLAWGVSPEVIYDAPVGADLMHFGAHVRGDDLRKRYAANGPLVVYVGQLNGAQYTHLFIESVLLLKEKNPTVRFLIVGTGNRYVELRERVKKLHIDDVLTFVGAVRHDLIPQYVAAADIAVACFEDNRITRCKSPLKVVEYLAAGKTIVASAVGEVKTMLEGCGILVKPGCAHALAEGIQRVLSDGEMRVLLEKSARKKAESMYNWPHVAHNLLVAYEHARHTHIQHSLSPRAIPRQLIA